MVSKGAPCEDEEPAECCLMRTPGGERKTPVQRGEAAGLWPGGRGRAQGLGRGQPAPRDPEGRHCGGGISLLMPPIF